MAIALPIIFSSNGIASEHIFGHDSFVWNRDTSGQPGDSVRIVYDSLGMPIDTIRNDSASSAKPLFEDLITYNAKDSIRFSINGKKMFLYGEAYVKYITTELKANYIELDMEKKLAYATGTPDSTGKLVGTPDFKDNGQSFVGQEMRYNFDTKKGIVTDIVTQQGEGYLQGKITKKQNDSIYCVKSGMYTTCDQHDHPHFGIRMTKAKMIKDKKVVTGPAYLEFEGIPLPIAIPFGFFPISKKGTSGIIIPSYGEERARGFNLRNGGYYFYINDHVDLTLTGDIYSNGSWALGAASTYKKRYKFSGQFQGNISKNYISEKGLPDYEESQDWSVRWTHSQDGKANPYATFSASVDMSSSTNNRYNPSDYNDIVNQRKQSSITWSKKWPESPFSVSGSFNHSQNSSDSTISLTLPNLSLRMTQIYPLRKKGKVGEMKWYDNIGITYSAELRNNINCKEKDLMNSSFTKNWNNGFKHYLPISLSFKLARDLTFTPSISYTGYLNLKTIEKIWIPDTTKEGGEVVTRSVPGLNYSHEYTASASLGYTPTIYGMFTFKEGCKVQAIRHVITPSLSASYTPPLSPLGNYSRTYFNGKEEEKYSIYDGMTYGPSITSREQSGSISFSLDNNIEMKVRNDKDTTSDEELKKVKIIESLRASISYNPFAEEFKFSTIALTLRTKVFNEKLDLNFSGTLDPYAIEQDENGSWNRVEKYAGGIGRLTNVSFSTSFNFSSDKLNKNKNTEDSENESTGGGLFAQYTEFNIPWSLNIDYTFSYSRPQKSTTINQNVRINGNFSLTPKWKFSFSTGYDFGANQVSSSNFSITRDLHCWEMTFNCIPFGSHQSYNFEIHVLSSMLRDLKLTKRESWYDL